MTLFQLFGLIREDLHNHGGKNFIRGLLAIYFNISLRVVLNYRLGAFLAERRNAIINLWILQLKKRQLVKFNCDISYHAVIGRRIKFPHPLCVVIGDKVKIGDDVMIWQEVTIGSHGREGQAKDYPLIGNRVKLFSGCKVIGSIDLGDDVVVGANAVVTKDIPNNHLGIGIPAKNRLK